MRRNPVERAKRAAARRAVRAMIRDLRMRQEAAAGAERVAVAKIRRSADELAEA